MDAIAALHRQQYLDQLKLKQKLPLLLLVKLLPQKQLMLRKPLQQKLLVHLLLLTQLKLKLPKLYQKLKP